MNFFVLAFFVVLGGIVFMAAGSATALSWFDTKWKGLADEQCAAKVVWMKKWSRAANRMFWVVLVAYILRAALGVKDIFLATGIAGIGQIDVFSSLYILVFALVLSFNVFTTSSVQYYKKRFKKDPFTQQPIGPG